MKNQELYQIMADHMEKNKNMLATVIEGENTGKRLFFTEGRLIAESGEKKFSEELISRLAETDQSSIIEADGCRIFVELLGKPGKLVICGGGHVAQALVPILTSVDFSCVILENREEFCRPELFPGAEDVRMIENWHLGDYVSIGEEDYVCVMTRGHKDDTIVQEQILRTPAAYIGVIGSRRKKASVFRVLNEDGFTDRDLERITTPIGLEIGAETPAEIAISIAAQMIEVRAKVRK